nr:immunoglobulin heavy chain junction region [Mus musculus]
ITVQGLLRASM